MTVTIHWTYAVLHLGLSIWHRDLFQKRGQHPWMLGLLVNTIALVYDNLILGMGSWIGVGSVLANLSVLRFAFHALFTPSLLWTGLYIANHGRPTWAMSRQTHRVVGIIVLVLIVVGIQESLLDYQAYPVCQQDGLVRYTQTRIHPEIVCDGIAYPVLGVGNSTANAAIGTCLILILMGLHVALVSGNGWLLLGSLLMCAAAAADVRAPTVWLGNGGEVVLVTSMTMAMREFAVKLPATLD